MSFLQKSNNNIRSAENSENEKLYDVAVSRYYYSLFQLIKMILIYENLDIDLKEDGSHAKIIERFIDRLKNNKKINSQQLKILNLLYRLKDHRVKADYKSDIFNENKYLKAFKPAYNQVKQVLDNILSKYK
jgi:uncharacterized protein (UPF0332 family)